MPDPTAYLADLIAAADERAAAAADQYAAAVDAAARGEQLDPAVLIPRLAAMGATVEQFAADVRRRVGRLELERLAGELPTLREFKAANDAAQAAAADRWKAATDEAGRLYSATVSPLVVESQELADRIAAAMAAEQALKDLDVQDTEHNPSAADPAGTDASTPPGEVQTDDRGERAGEDHQEGRHQDGRG